MKRILTLLIILTLVYCCTKEKKQISGYLDLERQYYSQQNPDSLLGSLTRKLYFNNDYSFLTVADSSATADDHLYIRDYTTNTVYLKKTFEDVNYYAAFPIEKEQGVTYTGETKTILGYESREGIHIGVMNDTTTFWVTDKIGLDRTIWSLVDVDGFVLEAEYFNGVKKKITNIHFEQVNDSFFKNEIEKIKTYQKESYNGLKVIEAKWELNYYKNRLKEYREQYNNKEISKERFERIEQDYKSWLKDIEDRIKELKEKDKM